MKQNVSHYVSADFFLSPADRVARNILGMYLVRQWRGRVYAAMITETEAYVGPEDKASHAFRGKTARTSVMFGPPGVWYVYLVYGMHYCLNVVTGRKGYPAAVLIRGVAGVSGPGKVSAHMRIGKSMNRKKIIPASRLWIAPGKKIPASRVCRGARVGIPYAEEWKDAPLRFWVEEGFL